MKKNKKLGLIETDRLLLREWTLADVEKMYEGLNNYNVAKNLTVPFPYTMQDAKIFINKRLAEPNNEKKLYFAVTIKETGEVIGGTSISIDENGIAEGGLWLNEKYHKKGYGTELFKARAEFCFDVLKANYLTNGFFDGNEASWHMQQKIGYKLRGDHVDNNCPARGGKTKEIKTILYKKDMQR